MFSLSLPPPSLSLSLSLRHTYIHTNTHACVLVQKLMSVLMSPVMPANSNPPPIHFFRSYIQTSSNSSMPNTFLCLTPSTPTTTSSSSSSSSSSSPAVPAVSSLSVDCQGTRRHVSTTRFQHQTEEKNNLKNK